MDRAFGVEGRSTRFASGVRCVSSIFGPASLTEDAGRQISSVYAISHPPRSNDNALSRWSHLDVPVLGRCWPIAGCRCPRCCLQRRRRIDRIPPVHRAYLFSFGSRSDYVADLRASPRRLRRRDVISEQARCGSVVGMCDQCTAVRHSAYPAACRSCCAAVTGSRAEHSATAVRGTGRAETRPCPASLPDRRPPS
ncbi:hypothetical protein LMG31884_06470 [Xanthomonas hydrangeae]|nr:hypothetical protein LMG31884_06470 [Xanthomonas hydrangeae]CAD7713516.1 hypothetical protein LMG31884_06470 [Xanthomonas hydrangeae]CAD7720086.1 hypothetical protein LMG31887_06470 [Xanthomonas hydrangeae]CAD7720090.1 hypothetical protein LMG31887_06470 [Xanthomonas hydrangeae]